MTTERNEAEPTREPARAPDTSRSERRFQTFVAVIAAAAALIGGASGAAISGLFQGQQDVANDVRERQKSAYADFIGDQTELTNQEVQVRREISLATTGVIFGEVPSPSVLKTLESKTDELERRAAALNSNVGLIAIVGSPETVEAADNLARSHRELTDMLSGLVFTCQRIDKRNFKNAIDDEGIRTNAGEGRINLSQEAFIAAARKDFGITP